MTIIATVLRTESTAEYQGRVYEQNVIIELSDGSQLGVFDPDMLVKSHHIGEKSRLTIGLLTGSGNIEVIEETDPRVEPSEEQPLFWKNHVYYGTVTDIGPGGGFQYDAVLDVGAGTVQFGPRKESFPELAIGDHVRVNALRTDLHAISVE